MNCANLTVPPGWACCLVDKVLDCKYIQGSRVSQKLRQSRLGLPALPVFFSRRHQNAICPF